MGRRMSGTLLAAWLGLAPAIGCYSLDAGSLGAGADASNTVVPSKDELPPDNAAQACLATAQALEKNGHDREAILEYERARQFNPRLKDLSMRLAPLYDRQGDSARAMAEYEKALALHPNDANLLNDVGYHYYEAGNLPEAEKWLRKAVSAAGSCQRAWINLGIVLGKEGHYDESYEAFAKAVSPGQARANVGMILAKQGHIEEAKQALRQALALDGGIEQARAVLKVLETPATPAATSAIEGGGRVSREPTVAGWN